MKRMILAAALAACSALATGCGGVSCSDKGKCANDTQTLGAEVSNCQQLFDGSCGGKFKDYAKCLEDNEVCDSSGNGSVASTACSDQESAVAACCSATPSACPSS